MCTMYNKFLIEWVVIQYPRTLDSSCLYLARPSDSPKYCRLVQYPVILDSYPSNKVYVHDYINLMFLQFFESIRNMKVEGSRKKLEQLIRNHGTDLLNRQDPSNGYTALHYAIKENQFAMMKLLLEQGAG